MIVNKYQGNGGGGGGSYVLPTATANRLGGVKVGSGLTITNDGTLSTSGGTAPSGESDVKVYFYDELFSGSTYDHTDLSVPNEMVALASSGTPVYVLYRDDDKSIYMALTDYSGNALRFYGDNGTIYMHCTLSKVSPWMMSRVVSNRIGDYNVVSQLPATAQEGQLFFVPAHTDIVPYPGYAITATTSEGFVAHIYDPENNETAIYRSGTDFHWDYKNDGEMHKREGKDFYYKTDNENGVFYAYLPDSSWTITLEEGSTSATTDPYNVEVERDGATYRYQNSGFTRASGYDDIYLYFDYNDINDTDKKQELLEKIFALQLENRKNIKLFVDNLHAQYINYDSGQLFIFEPYSINDSLVYFTSSVFTFEGGGGINNPIFASCVASRDENNIIFQAFEVSPTIMLGVDSNSHFLDSNGIPWMNINRATRQEMAKPNFLLKYKDKVFNGTYSKGRIYLDGKFENKTIHGEWKLNDEGMSVAEWTEEYEKYQTVSGLSNAGVNAVEMSRGVFSAPADLITGLTAETQLFVTQEYGDRYKVLADNTNIKIYYYATDAESWFVVASGTWNDSEIDGNGYPYHPRINNISTGSTYSFDFNFADYSEPGEVSELVEYYVPFEGLMAFDTSNSSLNLYASGQWNTLFPIVP